MSDAVTPADPAVPLADAQGQDDRPLIFISHRVADVALAERVRDWLKDRAGGKLEFFISSQGFDQSSGSTRTLTETIRKSAAAASVMLVLCTATDDDWNYCLLEMGIAMDPGNPSTTVVAMDCGYAMPPLAGVDYVKAYDVDGSRDFCRRLLTTAFFPRHSGYCVSTDTSESYIDAAAKELVSRIWKHLPHRPSDDFTVEPLPMLRLVIRLDAISEPAAEGPIVKRLLSDRDSLKRALEQNARVSGSEISGFILFGMATFPEMALSELIATTGVKREWLDRALSDIADAINKVVNQNRPPAMTARNNKDYYATLVRVSRRGGLGVLVCELCFIRALADSDD